MTAIAPVAGVSAPMSSQAPVAAVEPSAVAQQSFQDALQRPVTTLQIQPGPGADQIDRRLMEWIETSYERLQPKAAPQLSTGATPVGSEPEAVTTRAESRPVAKSETQEALKLLEHAFSFAIEATLLSKASTESTRIFNTFLKGQ